MTITELIAAQRKCRRCHKPYEPTPGHFARYDFMCRPCRKSDGAAYRKRRIALGMFFNSGDEAKENKRKSRREYDSRPENKKRKTELAKKYSKKPELRRKHEVRWLAQRAIESGKIIKQPCEICGEIRSEAHHDDYTKPLDVRWLCRKHHTEFHKELKRAQAIAALKARTEMEEHG